MENASKALIIAGATLIAVILISLSMFVFNTIRKYNADTQAQQQSNQVIAFNRFFVETAYDIGPSLNGIQIYGYDAYNIIRKIKDINEDINAPITIELSSSLSEASFYSITQDALGNDVKLYNAGMLKKKYNYTYQLDAVEGLVYRVMLSEV